MILRRSYHREILIAGLVLILSLARPQRVEIAPEPEDRDFSVLTLPISA